jgi:transcriptional regulator with GAF, ATPase, and Fis domain
MSPVLDFVPSEVARPPATAVPAWDVPANHAVGASEVWKAALKRAALVAPSDATVLLTGESGTGKEVVARLVHRASMRRGGPFVAINCAALPEQLLESELFGYERGAFTGAQHGKPGQIELAAGGVLFLDEVSEMSLSAQAKFLRVLQEREFMRLGGTRAIKANIRVIAAQPRSEARHRSWRVPRRFVLPAPGVRYPAPAASGTTGRHPPAKRRAPRGHRAVPRPVRAATD